MSNWIEITEDLSATDPVYQKFYDIQKMMNDYYETNLTPEGFYIVNQNKHGLRAFVYDDGIVECTVCICWKYSDILKLQTTAVGKYDTLSNAVSIAQSKMKELMIEYGVTSIYALWATENYPAGQEYYSLYSSRNESIKNGFSDAVTELVRPDTYKTVWYL